MLGNLSLGLYRVKASLSESKIQVLMYLPVIAKAMISIETDALRFYL